MSTYEELLDEFYASIKSTSNYLAAIMTDIESGSYDINTAKKDYETFSTVGEYNYMAILSEMTLGDK